MDKQKNSGCIIEVYFIARLVNNVDNNLDLVINVRCVIVKFKKHIVNLIKIWQ